MLTGKIDLDHKRNFKGEIICKECGRPIEEDELKSVWHGDYHEHCLMKVEQKAARRV
jgi:RNA polymerase-binding transcription factor DksA